MKLIKINFRKTTSVYINDVQKVTCYGDSPRCLKTYIPTRKNQDLCIQCLNYYDPKGVYEHIPEKELKYKKIKIIYEL